MPNHRIWYYKTQNNLNSKWLVKHWNIMIWHLSFRFLILTIRLYVWWTQHKTIDYIVLESVMKLLTIIIHYSHCSWTRITMNHISGQWGLVNGEHKILIVFQYTIIIYWNIKCNTGHSSKKCDRIWSRIIIYTSSCSILAIPL